MEVSGKVAMVSGGGSGLGAATARLLAKQGARVAVIDLNLAAAEAVANDIGGLAISGNVASEEEMSAALDQVETALGIPQILVNCAGIGTAKRILGRDQVHPMADFSRVINVNLIGSFNLLRLAAERMAKAEPDANHERGVVVMTSSIAAYDGQVGQIAYSASKGGINAMTLPAARELAQFGIRVLTIAPGLFKTPLMEELPEAVQQSLGESIPFPKRLGKPEEFAQMALHCVENSFLNGEVIRLDGSLRMAPR
jgi:NAD(P)-dependent dehydrogenase (short-subunit alcohol dehydrogenase family)